MVAAGGRSSSPRTLPTLTKWRPWGCVAPSPNRKVSAGCSHLQCHPGEGEPAHPTYPTARLPSRNVARECHPAPKEVAESQLVRDTWVGILIGRESSSLGRTCKILRTSRKGTGGESGIRTHGRVSPTHAFQACSFNHSDISPVRVNDLRAVRDQIIARRRRMHASSTSPLNPAVYGPPASRARKLCKTSKSLEITYGR
jgi:hypothetical protein